MIHTSEPEIDGAWDWDTAAGESGFKGGKVTSDGSSIGSGTGITSTEVTADWAIPGGAATYYLMMKDMNLDTEVCFVTFDVDNNGFLVPPKATATATITTPASDSTSLNDTGLATFAGTATAGSAGTTGSVSAVKWALQDSSSKYLNGGSFDSITPVWDATTGTTANWTLDLSGKSLTDGSYTLSIVALDDNSGVDSNLVQTRTFKVDNTAPTVDSIVRTGAAAELTNTSALEFTVTYNEPVKGVAANDFALTNCTFGSATKAGPAVATDYSTEWKVSVTASADGAVTLATAASGWTAQDQAGNAVAADQSESASYTYDATAPTVTAAVIGSDSIFSGTSATGQPLSGTIVLTVNDTNKRVSGTIASGITLISSNGGTAGTITSSTFEANGKISIAYSGLDVNKNYKLTVTAANLTDLAGNALASNYETAEFITTNGISVVPTFTDGSSTINKVYGGEEFTNAATVNTTTYPGVTATVGYTSNNTSVAEVDAATGEITIKGAGSTTITATTSNVSGDNGGTPYVTGSASYTLVVGRKDIQTNVASLSFSKEYDGANTLTLAELQTSGSGSATSGQYYLATGVGTEKLEITAITATYNAVNKGEAVGATATAITFADNSTALAANYKIDSTDLAASGSSTTLSSQALHGVIAVKNLTWKGTTAAMSSLDKDYDGTKTANVASTLNETANNYLDGVAAGDQSNVKLTIAVGAYTDAYASADVGDQDVTLPTTALSLTGTGADNYALPVSGTGIKAAISKATPTFQIAENGTQVALSTAKNGVLPQVSLNGTTWKALADLGLTVGASGADNVQLAYWVATPATGLVHCDCGYGNAQGHLPTCAGVVNSNVSQCNCTTLASGNSITAATSSTAIGQVHTADCAYTKAPASGKCDCGLGDSDFANIAGGSHDWGGSGATTETCSYAAAVPVGGSWKLSGDPDVVTYLAALAVGDTVKVKVYMATANTNLNAVADPGAAEANATGSFTVAADPVPPSGGGVSSYTVTYNVGEHGKLAEGAKKTESVNYKKSPKKVPEVVANEGYKFQGWSLDGKTVVDPTAEIITKRTTFTALYEEADKALAFNKTSTTAYIKGIEEDGELKFKPEAPMTRGEVAVMLVRTLNQTMVEGKDYAAGKFSDLNGDEWYAQAVGYLAELGVMKGLEDGTCGAEKYITRAEFVALVMRIDGIVTGENKFPDVSADNWASVYITAASAKGYVDGNEYGEFMPGADITRASVVKIMNGILGWGWDAAGEMVFTDVSAGYWAYNDIIKASTGK